jgi:DNA transformation protein
LEDYVLGHLAGLAGLRSRRMFGGQGLYAGDVFFGIIYRGRLYFRTSEQTRAVYIAAGMAPFRPRAGQTLRSYYEVPTGVMADPQELLRWAQAAARRT